jgi:PAS domain S-box-containing protein
MRSFSLPARALLWVAMVVVGIAVFATDVITNITLRSIEQKLPETVLAELYDLSAIIDDLSEVVAILERVKASPEKQNLALLNQKTTNVFDGVVNLRQTYVYDNLVHASAVHAVLAPAIADVMHWLEKGVSGYGPESPITIEICRIRTVQAYEKAKRLKRDSQITAQTILHAQRRRLDDFLSGVNLMFILTVVVTLLALLLLIRQQIIEKREKAAYSELQQTEQHLLESEQLYRTLITAIPDAVVRTDVNGKVVYVNRMALDISGYEPSEIEGKSMLDFIAPEDRPTAIENLQLVFEHVLEPRKYHLMNKAGEKIPFEVNSGVLRAADGTAYGIVNVCRDISARRRAEKALNESEKQYRLLFDNANDAIYIAQDEQIKFPNPKALEIMGYKGETTPKISFFEHIHPDDRDAARDFYRRTIKGADSQAGTLTFRVVNRVGREYTVQLNAVKILWQGRPAALNFMRDITEQVYLESSLRQAQKLESLGTLAGGIAHDFNNLLVGVQGRTSLMLMDLEAGDPFYDHLKSVEDYVRSAINLTQQLLGFARGGKYEIKPTDMNKVLAQSAELFGRTKKEVVIRTQFDPELRAVEVDRGQIRQVLLNLFVNAWQAMPGGGELFLRTENVDIKSGDSPSGALPPGSYVKVAVTDTGVGIEESTKSRLFEPFFTTKEMGYGTGLGLASSYGIIKNHGGLLMVSSKVGQGSTFSFFLPATQKRVEHTQTVPKELVKGSGYVLLIDDERIVLDVGEQILKRLGYQVYSAPSGPDAIDIYRRESARIDLVILDLIMPGMGGDDIFERLKEINPQVKVILSSGYSVDGKATELLERGCNAFIQKPFSLDELSSKIRTVLG